MTGTRQEDSTTSNNDKKQNENKKLSEHILLAIFFLVEIIATWVFNSILEINLDGLSIFLLILLVIYFLLLTYFIINKKLIFKQIKYSNIYFACSIVLPISLISIIYFLSSNYVNEVTGDTSKVGIGFYAIICILVSLVMVYICYCLDNYIRHTLQNREQEDNSQSVVNKGEILDEIQRSAKSINNNLDKYYGKQELALAATCVPVNIVKSETGKKIYTFCIIDNVSYMENAWMFPGGHVYLNMIKDHGSDSIKSMINDEEEMPHNVAKMKAESEAGLKNLKHSCIYTNGDSLVYSEDGYPLVIPDFTYLFRINQNCNCARKFGHIFHLDHTYIMSYDEYGDPNPLYNRIFISIEYSEGLDTNTIIKALSKKINDYIFDKRELQRYVNFYPATKKRITKKKIYHGQLFPTSIPGIMLDTIHYLEKYSEKIVWQ